MCSGPAQAAAGTPPLAAEYLSGLSAEGWENKAMFCTGKVINVTFLIFNKTYMSLEEKYSSDTVDQEATNTFINQGRKQSQQGKN